MSTDPFIPPAEDKLHTAIMDAVALLNKGRTGANLERLDTILRSALVEYADMKPGEKTVPWMPYMSDRADGVKGHYAIARMNPAGYREVWNLVVDKWSSFSDAVLTEQEAIDLLKTMSFGQTEHSRNCKGGS